MITSKYIIGLIETYLTSKHSFTGDADVFVNPSSSDYSEIHQNSEYNVIRFFLDNSDKKVYVWDAATGIHKEIADELKFLPRFRNNDPNLLAGEAGISSGRAVMEGSDMLTGGLTMIKSNIRPQIFKRNVMDVLNIDWSWADRYVVCSKFLSKFKTEFDQVSVNVK